MAELEEHFKQDLSNIGMISIIPNLLDVICQTTGMGFAAVARVTEKRWITCSVHDAINFGITAGDELEIKTTLCDEVRASNEEIIIDNVAFDPQYNDHPCPALYGFQSYISVPIICRDGSFFGTLCAIDPSPNSLKNFKVREMFSMFAELISFHLDALERISLSESTLLQEREQHKQIENNQKDINNSLENKIRENNDELSEKNISLEKLSKELDAFAYISSHDLQEPLRKIQMLTSIIEKEEYDILSEKGKHNFSRIRNSAERMQNLINDLLTYSRTKIDISRLESVSLSKIIQDILIDVKDDIKRTGAVIEVEALCNLKVIEFQFKQLFFNLISNSLKFISPDNPPLITIKTQTAPSSFFNEDKLCEETQYCHISFTDNGIGFEQKYSDKIFELFQSLHDKEKFTGTGIGLTIVKKIVANHQGHINVQAAVNTGTSFSIYIPILA
jgi:light-regulated signal transduction histidine kinase (bacteriophytochrome)